MPPELPLLILDASGPRTYAGLARRDGSFTHSVSPQPALESLFTQARDLLHEAGLDISRLGAFGLCTGPGSVLGLRLAAMAIRAWQVAGRNHPPPVYQYGSLALIGHHLGTEARPPGDFLLFTDWKKTAWRGVASDDLNRIQEFTTEDLAESSLPHYFFPQRKQWVAFPGDPTRVVEYPFASLPRFFDAPGFFQRHALPELPDTGGRDYAKWSGERHRRPGNS